MNVLPLPYGGVPFDDNGRRFVSGTVGFAGHCFGKAVLIRLTMLCGIVACAACNGSAICNVKVRRDLRDGFARFGFGRSASCHGALPFIEVQYGRHTVHVLNFGLYADTVMISKYQINKCVEKKLT